MRNPETVSWKIPWKGIIAALLGSSLALAVLFSKVATPAQVIQELASYPAHFFFLAVLLVMVSWFIDGQRVGVLARALGHSLPWWQLGFVLAAANFLTLVTPFAGGGGALIVYYFYRRGMSVPQATAAVTAGGIGSQICLSILAISVLPNLTRSPSGLANYLVCLQLILAAYIFVLLVLLYLAAKSKRLPGLFMSRKKRLKEYSDLKTASWLKEFQKTYKILLGQRKSFYLRSLLMAFLYYLVYYAAGFVLLCGFGVFGSFFRYSLSVLLGIAPVFSPIPGGAGAAELVAYLALEQALPKDTLGTFIVIWRTVVFYIPVLLGGAISAFFAFRWAGRKKHEPS
ncbi:MAG: flippase-like domain-containing protein [Firmicutes bacterium]|nr:flippase-like domain-containing protein [Bacillota bacterium]